MSYTNPDGSATYNQTSNGSNYVIGPDTLSNTYAKQVNLTGGKVISGAVVKSGGYANSGNWVNITVSSGGSFRLAGGGVTSMTVYSGGTLFNFAGGGPALAGKIYIQSGAVFDYSGSKYNVYTDDDGWLVGLPIRGAVHIRNGVKVKNPLISSFIYLSSGTIMSGGVGNATGLPIILANASATEFKVSKAEINRTGVTLGGSTTTISNTIYVVNGGYAATGTAAVGTFSVKNGIVSDLTLVGGVTTQMADIRLFDGIKAEAPVVSSGGALYIFRGGTATDVVWTPTEGTVAFYDGATVTFASDYSGVYFGSSNQLQSQAATMDGKDFASNYKGYVMNGGKLTNALVDNGYLYEWQGGEISGLTISNTTYLSSFVGQGHVSGFTLSGLQTSGTSSYTFDRLIAVASSGAFIEDADLQYGRLAMSQGATVSGATITGGALDLYDAPQEWHYDRAAMLVNEATVTAGRIFFRGSNASGANIVIANTDKDNYIQNGAYVSGLTIRSGKMVEHYNNTLVDGDLRPFVEDVNVSGGNLSIGWGAAKDVRITGGNIVVYGVADHPTLIEDLAVSGGTVAVVSNGALISGATFYGSGIYD